MMKARYIAIVGLLIALLLGGIIGYASFRSLQSRQKTVEFDISTLSELLPSMTAAMKQTFSRADADVQDIDLPFSDGLLPSGVAIPYQWEGRQGRFVLTAQDNVTVHRGPDFQAKVVRTLGEAVRVRIVHKDKEQILVDDRKGHWVFVTSEDGNTLLGWVFDTQLAYTNRFQKATDWPIPEFTFQKGEYHAAFGVNKNGRYTNTWRASGQGLRLKGSAKGQMMRYENIIWAKKDQPDDFVLLFFLNPEKGLHHEPKFKREALEIPNGGDQHNDTNN